MADRQYLATNIFVADGIRTKWPFSFAGVSQDDNSGTTPYLYPEDVHAMEMFIDSQGNKATAVRNVVIETPNVATIVGPPVAVGREIKIYRQTENRYPLVDYRDRQSVSESDLDLANRQAIFIAQETQDAASNFMALDRHDNYDVKFRRIVNLAPGIAPGDAVSFEQYERAIRVPMTEPPFPALPLAAERAGKLLAFNDFGLPFLAVPVAGSPAQILIDLANVTDPKKGASMVGGAVRGMPTLAAVRAWTSVPVGCYIVTAGYEHDNDQGGNAYIVEAFTNQATDSGNLVRVGDVVLRAVHPGNYVHIAQYGGKSDNVTDNTASWKDALKKTRQLNVPLHLSSGKYRVDGYVPWSNDKITGMGSSMTHIAFNEGDTGFHMSNTPYGVRYTMPPTYIKDTRFIGFTVDATRVKFGIYAVANLFTYYDDVRVMYAKVCNWFNAYIFGGKWMNIRADYGQGSGWEFGYNRWGWTPGVPGEPAALCHGGSIIHLDTYGNGIGEPGRPPLGSVQGAGQVWSDGLSNAVMLLYSEQNFGHGLVTVGTLSYSLGTVYLEENDKYRPEGTDRYDYYNAASEMSIGNLGPIYTGRATVWNAGYLVCTDFRGTKIDGPGPVKVLGNYRNAAITNPSVISVPTMSRWGTVALMQRSFSLPASMPADGTRKFFRGGVYRCYPEIVFEASGANITEARITITDSGGDEVYNERAFSSANPKPGMRLAFPLTDFTWNPNRSYRIALSGVTATYTGELVLSFIADIMA